MLATSRRLSSSSARVCLWQDLSWIFASALVMKSRLSWDDSTGSGYTSKNGCLPASGDWVVFDVEDTIQAIFIDGSDHLFVSRWCIAKPKDGLSERNLNPSKIRFDTTTYMGFYDISFISLKVVFSSSFIIWHLRDENWFVAYRLYHVIKSLLRQKTCFFIINLMTIVLTSLNYDACFSSLLIQRTSQKSYGWTTVHMPCRIKNVINFLPHMTWRWQGYDVASPLQQFDSSQNIWWPNKIHVAQIITYSTNTSPWSPYHFKIPDQNIHKMSLIIFTYSTNTIS